MSSAIANAFKQSLKRRSFLAVFLVLLLGAIGINATTSALHLFFRKEALPLRVKDGQGLGALPMRIGNWLAVDEAHTIDADMEHSLGTDKYLFRDYVDLSATVGGAAPVTTEAEVKAMSGLTPNEIGLKLRKFREKNHNAVLRLSLTYYTGKVDTVPHVPERCLVADGFQQTKWQTPTWHMGNYADGSPRDIEVRFIDFEDQTTREGENMCVTYFFHANGIYQQDPYEVRRRLQSLTSKYAYFSKIEVLTLLPRSLEGALDASTQREKLRAASGVSVQQFLTSALPEIEKMLPDPAIFAR